MPSTATCPVVSQADPYALNAKLREELATIDEEALSLMDLSNMTITQENVFLASLLAWEEAPALPIAEWFDAPLELSASESLTDDELRRELEATLEHLAALGVEIEFAHKLSARDLYDTLRNCVLCCVEKKVATRGFRVLVRFVDQDVENGRRVEMTIDGRSFADGSHSDSRAA